MPTPAELANLARAIRDLERGVNNLSRNIRDLFRVAEALNRNLVEVGRMMKKEEEINAP